MGMLIGLSAAAACAGRRSTDRSWTRKPMRCSILQQRKRTGRSRLLYDKERQESYPIDLLKSKNPFAFQLIMTVQRPGSTWDDR